MSRPWWSFARVAAAVVLLGWSGGARAGGDSSDGDGPPRLLKLLEENAAHLKLEPAKLAEIQALIADARARSHALRRQRRGERTVLRNLLSLQPPDRVAVERQVEVLGRLDTALLKERVNMLMDLRARLSEEQLAELGLRADGEPLASDRRKPCSGPEGP